VILWIFVGILLCDGLDLGFRALFQTRRIHTCMRVYLSRYHYSRIMTVACIMPAMLELT